MAAAKTTTPTARIQPVLEGALRTYADREHRSIANMVEVLIRGYCWRNGMTIQDRQALHQEDERKLQSHGR